jgi:hypothetical protein
MDPRLIYEIWAPPDGLWSPWVKPVLFAHMTLVEMQQPTESHAECRWEPPASDGRAMVLDLPGLESIDLGLDLIRHGYRPIPLFNGCPHAADDESGAGREAVPARSLAAALRASTDRVKSAALAPDAPPVFVVDSSRLGTDKPIVPGIFDNRWVVFPTDFPSAIFLAAHGIEEVWVVHRGSLAEDLIDVLQIWRRDGISLFDVDLNASGTARPLAGSRIWMAGVSRLIRRLWVALNLRRNPGGGFGALVPEAWAGG